MSEIPVGSPPAPPGRHAAPSGWYPDPVDLSRERYWDGWQWSREVRPGKGVPTPQRTKRPVPAAARPQASSQRPPSAMPPVSHHPAAPPQQVQPPGSGRQSATSRPQPTTADGVRLAGFWWKVLAAGIDQVMLAIVTTLVTLPFMGPFFSGLAGYWSDAMEAARSGTAAPMTPTFAELMPMGNQLAVVLITAGVQIAYHALLWRFWSATLAQRMLGLRVVPVDQGRSTERLSYAAVVPRAVIWGVPWSLGSLYFLGAINGLFSLWNPRSQALHDLVAKTQVVRIRD